MRILSSLRCIITNCYYIIQIFEDLLSRFMSSQDRRNKISIPNYG
ncbi:hypothetical protein pb186bvf_008143 [Paramecium bursaria]